MKWQHLRYCRTTLSTTKSGRLQKYFTSLQKYFCKLFWTSHTERNVKKMDYVRRKCSQNANIHNSNNSTLHYIATSGATSRSCARGCSSPGSRWTATNVSSNSAAVSNILSIWINSTCHFPVGYDNSQVRLSGKFSHDPRHQRVLQFSAVFRELEPGERVYTGSSSE